MLTRLKLLIIFLIVAGSFFLLPISGLPYGDFDWTVHSQPYKPPQPVPAKNVCIYVVKFGDTLFSIARRYGTSMASIAQANGISNLHQIYVGQTLIIPNCPRAACAVYVVRPGDTLYSIARYHGTSVRAIARQNRILHPGRIFIGQRLIICDVRPIPKGRIYVVKPGDTIYAIALRFGVSPAAIISANHLRYPGLIFPGQRLRIP